VCASVCVTCRVKKAYVGSEQLVGYLIAHLSKRGLLSGFAVTGAVYVPHQPATPFSFSHAGVASNLDAAIQCVSNGHRLYRTPSNLLQYNLVQAKGR